MVLLGNTSGVEAPVQTLDLRVARHFGESPSLLPEHSAWARSPDAPRAYQRDAHSFPAARTGSIQGMRLA
jgi:hypothetical protein